MEISLEKSLIFLQVAIRRQWYHRSLNTYVGPFLIVEPKRTLAASYSVRWVTASMPTGQTDEQTDGCYARPLHYAFR